MNEEVREVQAVEAVQSEQLGELFAALAKAQGAMTGAVKDSSNPFFKSKYADLHQIWEAVRKPLSDNQLSVVQTMKQDEYGLFVVTTIGHSSGQWMKSYTPVKAAKPDAQAMGSATTYARRYSLAAICGIAQMDDDGEAAVGRTERKKPARDTKALKLLKDAADKGLEPLQAAWQGLTKEQRAGLQDELPKLKEQASA